MPANAGPTFDFLRLLLEAMPQALRTRLEQFHLVHPSLKMRIAFVFLGVLLWGKLEWVDRLSQLHRHFVPGQLHVPEFVVHLDDVDDRPRVQQQQLQHQQQQQQRGQHQRGQRALPAPRSRLPAPAPGATKGAIPPLRAATATASATTAYAAGPPMQPPHPQHPPPQPPPPAPPQTQTRASVPYPTRPATQPVYSPLRQEARQ